jgi:hypothetical protein
MYLGYIKSMLIILQNIKVFKILFKLIKLLRD